MEHIVHVREVGRKLKLIGEVASFANDLERTHVSRGKLPFDTEATSALSLERRGGKHDLRSRKPNHGAYYHSSSSGTIALL